MSLDLERSYAACEAVTRAKAKSFYFASAFLPPYKRRGVFALYDFCRYADDLVDERGDRPVEEVSAALDDLGAMLRASAAGEPPADPRWAALHDTLDRHPVPLEPLLELLEGVRGDLGPRAFETTAELLHYCHQVAGVVGLALGPLLGARRTGFESAGAALGVAMQLTNVLRDVGADATLGRRYLPTEELVRFGLTPGDLVAGQVDERWQAFMAFQIARAREYYAAGDLVVPLFPDDGSRLTVRLMQRTYAGILDAIERNGGDVFSRRAHIGLGGKLALLAGAYLSERPAGALRLLGRRGA
jgi:phytoene synthase